jgi:probable F420-dependent oxidoreductase
MSSGASDALPRVGVFADCTDRSMPIVDLAVELEARGFTGLYLNEHPHLPVANGRSAYPAGGEIPDRYARFWDPFIALSFVAARTSLEVGPTVSLVAEHDAIALAKAIATLDVLSSGRLLVGVGFGWHREEFEDHGLPANVRPAVVEETVELMKRLWCDDVAEYAGTYRRLSPSRSWPKPAQHPHPPVLLGAPASDRNFDRVVRWADGWIPMANPILEPAYEAWIRALRHRWEAAGRDPADLQLLALLTTTPVRDLPVAIERAGRLGVQRVAVRVNEGRRDEVMARLDRLQAALAPVFAIVG